MTPRQLAVLRAVGRLREELGYSPTIREIGVATGIKSTNGVVTHLMGLEVRGLILRESGPRTLRLSPAGERLLAGAADSVEAA